MGNCGTEAGAVAKGPAIQPASKLKLVFLKGALQGALTIYGNLKGIARRPTGNLLYVLKRVVVMTLRAQLSRTSAPSNGSTVGGNH